jgi:hypothetical protein
MKPALVVILSGLLTFGVPLAVALWEVIVLRRNARGQWRSDGPPPPEPPRRPDEPPQGQRQLPACLIPQRRPDLARVRVLESV